MLLIRSALKALFLPPGLLIVAGLLGLWLLKWRPRIGKSLLLFSLLGLYLFSTPALVVWLSDSLEDRTALNLTDPALEGAGAIVVLGGGSQKRSAEYGGDTLKVGTLSRLHHSVYLHRQTGLPLLVSGGLGRNRTVSEAHLMGQNLKDYYGVEVRWLERSSRTTWENARHSAEILFSQNIQKIVLVTEAYHMNRAIYSFEQFGFEVIPAPHGYSSSRASEWDLMDFLPDAKAFVVNYKLLHERVGLIAYRVIYN